MNKIFLISHNEYALGLKKALEMIAGKQENLYAYGLMPGGHPKEIMTQIKEKITEEDHVIILGDIAGGSVCNAALELTQQPNVSLVCGTNLPLAMEIILTQPKSKEAIETILSSAREGIKMLELEIASKSGEDDFFGE